MHSSNVKTQICVTRPQCVDIKLQGFLWISGLFQIFIAGIS